ncbi:MAG: hypothetical protein H6733_13145 [Alphaproteobacteria bacterium]|nr:hypothetical protein [Alphaproteobacteria bacterium]
MRPRTVDVATRLGTVLALLGACNGTTSDKTATDDTLVLPDTGDVVDSDTVVVDTDVVDTDDTDPLVVDTDTDTLVVDTDTDPLVVDTDTDPLVVDTDPLDLQLLSTCVVPTTWTPDTALFYGLVELTDCVPIDENEVCPSPSDPLPWSIPTPGRQCTTEETLCITGFVGRQDESYDTFWWDTGRLIDTATGAPLPVPGLDRCCYTYIGVLATYQCGRPFKPAGSATTAMLVTTAGWSGPVVSAPDAHAAALARWTDDALAEHASIAAFAGVVLDLLAHGAPADLVAAAQQALAEEVDHARGAFAVASRLAGAPVGPGPLDTHRTPRTLVDVAVEAAVEGGLAEALAAATAAARLAVATDPDVRAHLARVVDDEARHAVLGWRIVDWAVAVGGHDVARAVDTALADAFHHHLHADLPDEPCVPAWGLPGVDAIRAARHAVLTDVFGVREAA